MALEGSRETDRGSGPSGLKCLVSYPYTFIRHPNNPGCQVRSMPRADTSGDKGKAARATQGKGLPKVMAVLHQYILWWAAKRGAERTACRQMTLPYTVHSKSFVNI